MPTYRITAPDGNTYKIDGPDGASKADVVNAVLEHFPDAGKPPTGFVRGALQRGAGATVEGMGRLLGEAADVFMAPGLNVLDSQPRPWRRARRSTADGKPVPRGA